MYACIILHIRVLQNGTVHSSMYSHGMPWEYRISCSTLNRLSSPLFLPLSLDIASHQGLSKFRQIPRRRPFLTGKNMTINMWGTSAALSDTPKPLVHFFVHTNIGGKGMFIAPQQLFNKFWPHPIPWLVPHDQKTMLVSCIEWTWRKRRWNRNHLVMEKNSTLVSIMKIAGKRMLIPPILVP